MKKVTNLEGEQELYERKKKKELERRTIVLPSYNGFSEHSSLRENMKN